MEHMSIRKEFGRVLREARKKRGISQERLALDSGMDRAYVSRLERGVTQPTLETIFRLSGVLGITPSVLVRRVEQKQKDKE